MRAAAGAVLLVAGCGRVGFDSVGAGITGDGPRGDTAVLDGPGACSWTAPAAIASVASASEDWEPALSPDRATLVFTRQATPTSSPSHLYMATATGGVFGAPVLISSLTSANSEGGPAFTPDGAELYFSSDRVAAGAFHLYTAAFDGTSFAAPTQIAELASFMAAGPALSPDGLELFFTDVSSMTAHMLHAHRATTSSQWTPDGVVAELDSNAGDGWPSLTPDGLTIYWESDRGGLQQIWTASRPAISQPFANIVPAPMLNPSSEAGDPEVSHDGNTILFAAKITGNAGLEDIYRTDCL